MNFEAFKAFVLEECSDTFEDRVLSNSMFRAIRDAQEECLCSFYTYDLTISSGVYGTGVRRVPLSSVTFSLGATDYGYATVAASSKDTLTIQPLNVLSVHDVTNGDPDGDDAFNLTDKATIDTGRFDTSDGDFMAVAYDRSSLCLFTNSDLDSKILRIRCNFLVEYSGINNSEMGDSKKADIYLSTIPIQVRRYLEAGVKSYFYRTLSMDLQRDDLKERYAFYRDEWHRKFLPQISQIINDTQPEGLVYSPRAPFMIDPKD